MKRGRVDFYFQSAKQPRSDHAPGKPTTPSSQSALDAPNPYGKLRSIEHRAFWLRRQRARPGATFLPGFLPWWHRSYTTSYQARGGYGEERPPGVGSYGGPSSAATGGSSFQGGSVAAAAAQWEPWPSIQRRQASNFRVMAKAVLAMRVPVGDSTSTRADTGCGSVAGTDSGAGVTLLQQQEYSALQQLLALPETTQQLLQRLFHAERSPFILSFSTAADAAGRTNTWRGQAAAGGLAAGNMFNVAVDLPATVEPVVRLGWVRVHHYHHGQHQQQQHR